MLYVENDRAVKAAELIGDPRSFNYDLFEHLPPHFNPRSFYSNVIFGELVSQNLL